MRQLVTAVAAVLCLALVACGGDDPPAAPQVTNGSVRGLVTNITLEANDSLVVFSVRPDGGDIQTFQYAAGPSQPLDVPHLREHMAQKWPVTVNFTRTGNNRGVATAILD